MSWVLIHGSERKALAPNDRAALYGDALFETLLWSGTHFVFASFHWHRLFSGAERLKITMDLELFQAFIADIEAKLKLQTAGVPCAVRISVHRSVRVRGYGFGEQLNPELVCLVNKAPVLTTESIALGLSTIQLARQPVLAGLKHVNRLEQVLATQALAEQGYDDGVMCIDNGHVVCTTRANVYALINDVWHTPSLNEAGVAGTRRAWFLQQGAQGCWAVEEGSLTIEQLYKADAVMISNALRGFQGVASINGHHLSSSVRLEQVRQRYAVALAADSR